MHVFVNDVKYHKQTTKANKSHQLTINSQNDTENNQAIYRSNREVRNAYNGQWCYIAQADRMGIKRHRLTQTNIESNQAIYRNNRGIRNAD